MEREKLAELVMQFTEAFNREDLDGVMSFMAEDAVYDEFNGTLNRGAAAIRAAFDAAVPRRLRQAPLHTEDLFVDAGSGKALIRWLCTLETKRGPAAWRGLDILHVANGRITEKLTYAKAKVATSRGDAMTEIAPIQRVAVALFEGFTVLDVYGPVQAFASSRIVGADGKRQPLFEIFSMAAEAGRVKAGEGPASWAEWSFEKAPDYDILLIPGGFGTARPSPTRRSSNVSQPPAAGPASRRPSARARRSARPYGPPRRPARDVEQDRLGLGRAARAARALEAQGALGRRRQRADLVRRLGGDRHGAEPCRAPARPGDGADRGAEHGVRVARGGGRRSVRVTASAGTRARQEGRAAGDQRFVVAPASIRRIGRSSRVSGFTMSPRVSSVTAPSSGASSGPPSTTGDVAPCRPT